ncbi:MAG: hypothetical protein QOG64_1053 [Acidimicrobiaceae bacterium]|nr:hypothetical protein [Acidimicrobiaceae bacterium]
MAVYTVGHGTRSTEELVAVLRSAGAGRLVDVRRYPGSRRHPHLAREPLTETLPAAGIAYQWRGEELGGRRRGLHEGSRHPGWDNPAFRSYADYTDTAPYRTAITRLMAEAERDGRPPLAVMCAETLWWRCHRRLIADSLAVHGVEVIHLVDERNRQLHTAPAIMRVDEDGWPVYDAGVDVPFL